MGRIKNNIDWDSYYMEYIYWVEYAEYVYLTDQDKENEGEQDKI